MDDARDLGWMTNDAARADLARDLIVATGADRVRFLHGVVTGDVAGTPVGGGCHAALLTAKAHVVADMRIFVRDADLYVVVAAGQGAATAEALSRYAIMDDFTAVVRADSAFFALLGRQAGLRLAAAGYPPGALESSPLWSHADVFGEGDSLFLVRARQLGAEGYWVGGPAPALARLDARLGEAGVPHLDAGVGEAARIAAGEPAWGREITPDYFPMEVGLNDAIDYGKGCFLGQEPIVRIRDRGHVNWRLVRLDLDAEASERLPSSGARIESDVKPKAGKLTSAARLPDGRGVALALLHVSVPVGQQVAILSAEGARVGSATVSGEAV